MKRTEHYVYKTKNHRVEFVSKEGEEELRISTAGGKMRMTVRNGTGIRIENGLGDIRIKCRKFVARAGGTLSVEGRKKVSLHGGNLSIQGREGTRFEAGGEIRLEGGTSGCTGPTA